MENTEIVNDFSKRVNYAVLCFKMHSTGGRKFDAVFEMYDGEFVVTAILRRAIKDPSFKKVLFSQLNMETLSKWIEKADKYNHLSTRELGKAAYEYRLQKIKESEKEFEN